MAPDISTPSLMHVVLALLMLLIGTCSPQQIWSSLEALANNMIMLETILHPGIERTMCRIALQVCCIPWTTSMAASKLALIEA